MAIVACIAGNVRIAMYHKDHGPPHFHAIDGNDEALFTIAAPIKAFQGKLKPGAERDVIDWATDRRAALALNWVDALAKLPIQRIP